MRTMAIGSDTSREDPLWNTDSWQGWMTVDGKEVPKNWERSGGIIHLRASEERTGHVVTRQEVGDFTLKFDWKIAPGGNSGIKYHVQQFDDRMLGCEYQIYDPGDEPVDPKNTTGALYDLYAPSRSDVVKPAGEWNAGIIRVQNQRIEHWLNGERIVTATIGDSEWERRVAESKFFDVPDFAKKPKGRIMLTDHGSEVWYRNFVFETG